MLRDLQKEREGGTSGQDNPLIWNQAVGCVVKRYRETGEKFLLHRIIPYVTLDPGFEQTSQCFCFLLSLCMIGFGYFPVKSF